MRKKRRLAPIYAFALVWIIGNILLENFGLLSFLILIGLSAAVAAVVAAQVSKKEKAERAAAEAEAEAERRAEAARQAAAAQQSKYSPEVQAIIDDGRIALKELGRLYGSIQNREVRSKINEIMSVSDKIIRDAIDDESDVPQIRRFLDYYLPTTIELLNTYDRMGQQDVSGENISGSMERIEEMLDTSIEAYKKQLDALFANQASDIQTDIEVMNNMLAREGLGGKSYLDINEFMKNYEQQKGSTSNG